MQFCRSSSREIELKKNLDVKNPAFRQDFLLWIIEHLYRLFFAFAGIFQIVQRVFIAEFGGFFKILHGFGFVAP